MYQQKHEANAKELLSIAQQLPRQTQSYIEKYAANLQHHDRCRLVDLRDLRLYPEHIDSDVPVLYLGVYFASRMFNVHDPRIDLSSADKSQLEVERAFAKSLDWASTLIDTHIRQEWDSRFSVKLFPVIPRAFEAAEVLGEPEHYTSISDFGQALVELDLAVMQHYCDAFLLNHVPGPSAGTCMELFHAKRELKIPTVTLARPGPDDHTHISPWVAAHSDVLFQEPPHAGFHLHLAMLDRLFTANEQVA